MSETNINAFKAELAVAERELDRAQSRVDELKAYIEANEPKEIAEPEKEVPKEPQEDQGEKIEVKTSKKGSKK